MDILLRIKRLVAQGHVRFTHKAEDDMEAAGLKPAEVAAMNKLAAAWET